MSKARRMHDLVEGLEQMPELSRYVPDFELCIDDLALAGDAELMQRPLPPLPKVALWLLRDGRDIEALMDHLAAWGAALDELATPDPASEDAMTVVRYLLRVAGHIPAELVQHRIREVAPSLEKPTASAAEQLIQEGIVKGREEGREEALRVTLERLLQLRFDALDPPARTRIQAAPRAELDRLIERVVTAVNLEDVFAS
jgi:hypothetical protein